MSQPRANQYRLTKACQTLSGILEGISIDNKINDAEIYYLSDWLKEHADVANRPPFNEIAPLITSAIQDGIVDNDERADILWLCNKLSQHSDYYDLITTDLQHLHGLLAGVIADATIKEKELAGLSDWLSEREYLEGCWPYDEVNALITAVMRDKKIDQQEHAILLSYFSDFAIIADDKTITNPPILTDKTITGVCSACPNIIFKDKLFCFTGASSAFTRNQFKEIVESLEGKFRNSVSWKTDYLIIGAEGNPCWSYSCYGRKVEEAIRLRKDGKKIQLIHENDFHDALADIY